MKKKLIFSYTFLAVMMVLLVVGVFAWFSLSETSKGQGASIVATSKGVLKIYPAVDASLIGSGDNTPKAFSSLQYGDFVNNVDFRSAPFKISGLVEQEKSNISGDGKTFFYLTKETPVEYSAINGELHKYITFDLYFTGFSGVAGAGVDKGVYLTGGSLINDVTIRKAVRVAFISNNDIVGIWAPYTDATEPILFVTSAGPAGTTNEPKGEIATNPTAGQIKRIIANNTSTSATKILEVNTGKAKDAAQKVSVVMWIEGTDEESIDANLGQTVMLSLDFAMDDADRWP